MFQLSMVKESKEKKRNPCLTNKWIIEFLFVVGFPHFAKKYFGKKKSVKKYLFLEKNSP